jgi:hypothetical protein
LLTVSLSHAEDHVAFEEFRDAEYDYVFCCPVDWKLQKLPEGDANKDMRFARTSASNRKWQDPEAV